MVRYGDVQMELVNIDRFERELVMTNDGVDGLYNQYTIQVTAIVHFAYVGGTSPFEANQNLRIKLMTPRQKFKITFESGGAGSFSNGTIGDGDPPFGPKVQADNPFTWRGPTAAEKVGDPLLGGKAVDVVPDRLEPGKAGDPKEEDVLIESPMSGFTVDAKLGPQPLFCHITRFLGNNGFVITWAVRTWLNDCFTAGSLSPLLSNRFVMVHNVDADQVTTITTYGQAIFQTDRLLATFKNPDSFRGYLLAPIWYGFRRDFIQVKQMSDTTVTYQTQDHQTPVIFNPVDFFGGQASTQTAIRAAVNVQRALYEKQGLDLSILNATKSYYDFKAQKNWADQDVAAEKKRAEDSLSLREEEVKNMQAHTEAMTRLAKANTRLARTLFKRRGKS